MEYQSLKNQIPKILPLVLCGPVSYYSRTFADEALSLCCDLVCCFGRAFQGKKMGNLVINGCLSLRPVTQISVWVNGRAKIVDAHRLGRWTHSMVLPI